MNSAHDPHAVHQPSAGGGTTALPFPEVEWNAFQAADRGAGRAVISLMAGIFTIGLILYLGVVYWILDS